MIDSIIGILIFVSVVVHGQQIDEQIIFNRKVTGVHFTPYIIADESIITRNEFYTPDNVRTMLEVVSTKFTRVLISSVDARNVEYKRNDTYYRGANARARTAEMAALINRERNNLSLTVTIGIHLWDSEKRLNTEMNVALEAFQMSQSIFPGTVEGLIMWTWDSHSLLEASWINKTLNFVEVIREKFTNKSLPLGLRQNCESSLRKSTPRAGSNEAFTLQKRLLHNLDFFVCDTNPDSKLSEWKGTAAAFNAVQSQMLAQRDDIRSIDNSTQVMRHAWSVLRARNEIELNSTKHVRDLRDYWINADKFATQYNYAVWLYPAIGYTTIDGSMGWWNLILQDLIDDVSGYVESISELPPEANNDFKSSETNVSEKIEIKEISEENYQTTWQYVTIIIGAMFSVTALAIFAGKLYYKWSSSRFQVLTGEEIQEFRNGILRNDYNQTGEENFVNTTALTKPYDRLLEIPKEKLEILTSQMLGGGEFGCVFKALIRDEDHQVTEVAMKTTKPNCGVTAIKGLLSEIKILSYLGQHPNIVPIVGAYTAEISRGTVYVATELCPLGSLKSCLQNFQDSTKPLDLSLAPFHDMIRWSYEIACGMEYLEVKGVIHADLATRNVLLSSESVAKITDFGLSRRLYEYTNYTKTSQEPLPWRWMAYESLKKMDFSTKSDVWSYGVTLWEIFSLGSQPYPGLAWTVDFVDNLEEGLCLKQPRYASTEIFEIMKKCWTLDKISRPLFSEVKNSMQCIKENASESLYTKLTS